VDDYFYAIMSWGMTLSEVKKSLVNNIHYAADLDENTKEAMLNKFN